MDGLERKQRDAPQVALCESSGPGANVQGCAGGCLQTMRKSGSCQFCLACLEDHQAVLEATAQAPGHGETSGRSVLSTSLAIAVLAVALAAVSSGAVLLALSKSQAHLSAALGDMSLIAARFA